ncbi:GNAT family N-acetyltransferase [Streptococcus gallolyticus]|uniref:GNAT family N-acetyltransferase n=1 Tax=Streptococcus hepaticus TaxID=3349163 RepID=UPI001C94C543|nr:GNAT family N-acetyltransferase [Streptococcus gallolyticus]MBY5040505.1 GNAT family N-acetyltransferase [Streptococcus gallolyticus]
MKKLVVGAGAYQRAASIHVRYQVFVLEGSIPKEEEFDQNDHEDTIYAVMYEGENPVSTARFLPLNNQEARITRVATCKKQRGLGYAGEVVTALEDYAVQHGIHRLIIHSELAAKSFYESIGYQAYGEVYMEDGVPCQSLEKIK